MQGLHKFREIVFLSAALAWAGSARAEETPLINPLSLEHSACPEEAFVAATAEYSHAHRKFSSAQRMPNGRTRAEGILTLQESEERPMRRAFRGSRLRNVDGSVRDESPALKTPRLWRAETPVEATEGGLFPFLPYFQAANEDERDGAVELVGFLAGEPSTCPAEETPDCDEECPHMLPGEAAREILALRKRLGPALGGTSFDLDCEELAEDPAEVASRSGAIRYLVDYIRLLERQENERPLVHEYFEFPIEPPVTHSAEGRGAATPEARDALREAGERLDATANLLERQDLYDQADEVRQMAASLRQQARGSHAPATRSFDITPPCGTSLEIMIPPCGRSSAAPRCGGRMIRPTVRSPQTCPDQGVCPVEACPANVEHRSITWIADDEDARSVRAFHPEAWTCGKGASRLEHTGPWWSCYPVAGPCGSTSGIRVGLPPGTTARDAIRFAPRESTPHETIERLPPIVEGLPAPAPRGIPSRSSFDAISEALQLEQEMEMTRALRAQRIQDRIESELLRREIEELGQLTEEVARQQRDGRRPVGNADPGEMRREISRLRRQLESPSYR